MNLKSYSKFHIDVWISEEDGKVWRFTGFYGESVRTRTEGIMAYAAIFEEPGGSPVAMCG